MAKSKQKDQQDLLSHALRTVLATGEGRRLFWFIVDDIAGVSRSAFSAEPTVAAFNEGKREVGLKLMAEAMRAAPKPYLESMQHRAAERLLLMEEPNKVVTEEEADEPE